MRDPKNVTVLIVDDEEDIRFLLGFEFEKRGCRVEYAENGRAAFELAKTKKIDAILSDVRMPGGDGFELLKQVQTLNGQAPIVILVSGYSDHSLEDLYDAGAAAVFAKPFDRKALYAAVMNALEPREERWRNRPERVDAAIEVEIRVSDMSAAMKVRTLNIGRGGMFIALSEHDAIPPVNTTVSFSIVFEGAPQIIGSGSVRWTRDKPMGKLPPGCGIEFTFLDETDRSKVLHLINELKTNSYIPKI